MERESRKAAQRALQQTSRTASAKQSTGELAWVEACPSACLSGGGNLARSLRRRLRGRNRKSSSSGRAKVPPGTVLDYGAAGSERRRSALRTGDCQARRRKLRQSTLTKEFQLS